jgi:uncharacterized membrane protein YhfC
MTPAEKIKTEQDITRIGLSKRSKLPMLTLRTHSMLDYLLAALTMVSPYLFGFSNIERARNLFFVVAIAMVIYSAITDYKYSLLKIFPFGLHRVFDWTAGAFIATGYSIFTYRPLLTPVQIASHIILGFIIIGTGALTRSLTLPEVIETANSAKKNVA